MDVCVWVDEKIIDRLVNGLPMLARRIARGIGWIDDQWVDGAVIGVAGLAGQMGDAARAPQTGRIRGYVTVLVGAAALAIVAAAAVIADITVRRHPTTGSAEGTAFSEA